MSFPVSEKIDAFTNKTTAQVEKWLGSDDEYFVLVDTPGFSVIAEIFRSISELPDRFYSTSISFAPAILVDTIMSVCLSPWAFSVFVV